MAELRLKRVVPSSPHLFGLVHVSPLLLFCLILFHRFNICAVSQLNLCVRVCLLINQLFPDLLSFIMQYIQFFHNAVTELSSTMFSECLLPP